MLGYDVRPVAQIYIQRCPSVLGLDLNIEITHIRTTQSDEHHGANKTEEIRVHEGASAPHVYMDATRVVMPVTCCLPSFLSTSVYNRPNSFRALQE
jgi:hypothetical protein